MATFRLRRDKDGKTRWHVQVRLVGYPARTESFGSEREAKKWAKVTEAEMIEGRHINEPICFCGISVGRTFL